MVGVTPPRLNRRRRTAARRLLAVAAVLAIATAWLLSHAGTALIVEHDAGPPDAIIMLASHEWERLPATAALARRHPDAMVMMTIPQVITPDKCHRCGERVKWLEREGISHTRIRLLASRPANTHGEGLAARSHALREPFARLAVVTSPYHTRRALATFTTIFEGSGIDVRVIPAEPAQGQPARWWLHRYDRHYVRYEWAAILWYRWQYGVPIA